MPGKKLLIKHPFEHLDAYTEEALTWAKGVSKKIELANLKEKDSLFISVAFAYIFGAFIHSSMKYPETTFEDYFEDYFGKYLNEIDPDPFTRMHNCRDEIFSSMRKYYGLDPLFIYKELYEAILIEREDEFGDMVKAVPYDYDEFAGYNFVCQGGY